MNLQRVTVIIPAYNEQESLPKVLSDLPAVGRIIVANNGSTDRTAEVAAAAGAIVVDEPRRGYGSACLAGMAKLSELVESEQQTPEIVVFVDGDYSDHPEQLTELVEPIFAGPSRLRFGFANSWQA